MASSLTKTTNADGCTQNPCLLLGQIVKVARPVHWIKNLALFAALIFSGSLLSKPLFARTLIAFASFCLAASATYIFNDILDAKLDRLHPIKKNRPIASRKLLPQTAFAVMAVLVFLSLSIASRLNTPFLVAVASYLSLQAAYSLGLKNLAIIDILIIAFGFVIRVYAGALVINAHLSVWFLLCVISVALFLASGKRRAELGIITATKETTRKSLSKYSETLIDSYVTMFANAAWMSWALFTFFESPSASIPVWIFLAEISRTTAISKLLMLTIPVVIFGIMRYLALIFEDRSEAPEKLLLTDKALVTSAILWSSLVIWILYSGVAHAI
jgi:4-hydroxybenzoate polyprenyltransferase